MYRLPAKPAQAEFTERKSRFIGHITPVSTEQQALDFLREVRARYKDASHNVYAYHVRDGGLCRHSDDGEPSGTAGLPLLEVFTKQGVCDFCCVATRYFGGIMLGAGGLVRAYARCGAAALEASGLAEMRLYAQGSLVCSYAQYEPLRRLLEDAGAAVTDAEFTEAVTVRFSVPGGDWDALCAAVSAHSAGTAACRRGADAMVAKPIRI